MFGFREKNLSVLASVIGEGLHVFLYLQVFIPSLPKFKRWQDIAFLKQHGGSQVKHCAVVTVLLGLLSPSVSRCGAFSRPRRERCELRGHQVQAWVGVTTIQMRRALGFL